MIPVSTLYDEIIDRPKLTEQKKNSFEYIVPSPQEGSEQKMASALVNCDLNPIEVKAR